MGSGRDSRVGLARGGGEGRGVRKGPWQQTRPLLPGDPSPLRPSRPRLRRAQAPCQLRLGAVVCLCAAACGTEAGLFRQSRVRAERRRPRPARACKALCKAAISGWFTQVLY